MTNIAIVGEAWGKEEEARREPFVGSSGRVLNYLLNQVGISRRECFITNVFNLRPKPSNDVKNLCGPKAAGIPGLPPLVKGKYVYREYATELKRLYIELQNEKPNVIIALGATAAWALLGTTGIRNIRGYVASSQWGKVLPTYHPAAVIRQWSLNPIVLADLTKARRESEFPEICRPNRELWIEPTIEDLNNFFHKYIKNADLVSSDIETLGDRITCVGFGTKEAAIVIPFFDELAPGKNYWRTKEEELQAWAIIRHWYKIKKTVFQNGLYDLSFLYRVYGITVPLATEDTMLASHAQQPEMEKGLRFLASIHTNELEWKGMRKNATIKKED